MQLLARFWGKMFIDLESRFKRSVEWNKDERNSVKARKDKTGCNSMQNMPALRPIFSENTTSISAEFEIHINWVMFKSTQIFY